MRKKKGFHKEEKKVDMTASNTSEVEERDVVDCGWFVLTLNPD